MRILLLCLFWAVVSVTDFNGRTTTRAQDVAGRVTTVTFPAGDPYTTVSYEYTPGGKRAQVIHFDDIGAVKTMTYRNGLVTTYTYNDRNWLRMMETRLGTTLKVRFDYDNAGDPQTPWAGDRRLSPIGLRRSVQETIGSLTRTVDYDYDSLHRLIKENIQDGSGPTGSVDYGSTEDTLGYDLVGNRRSRIASSSLQTAGITSFTGTDFNALDQPTDGRSFDHNGNTTSDSTGASYVYDAQNLLIRRTGGGLPAIELTYDADGNRAKRTATPGPGAPADVTLFLVDELNPTGYAQVIEERDAAGTTRMSYVYGLDLISQKNNSEVHYYGYDGLGSVRYLSDSSTSASITDTYTYDAFGILINQTGSTPNAYRYTGEQYDQHLGMYYLRARYYKPELGRFWTMDTYEGSSEDPLSLHKYLYAADNPVNGIDPTGNYVSSIALGNRIHTFLGQEFLKMPEVPNELRWTNKSVRRILRERFPNQNNPSLFSKASLRRPDLVSATLKRGEVYEIKPAPGILNDPLDVLVHGVEANVQKQLRDYISECV